jgi:tRNA-specific 2-thiouridylase
MTNKTISAIIFRMNTASSNKKIVLGLSGGVDSAVAAYLLKEQGYEVFGVYLKNWTEKDEKGVCPAERDREDAMRVAAKLGISFTTVDYEKEYRDRVFAPFLEGLSRGINPNPDILCNPLVKFAALITVADDLGASFIATGHYARKITLPTLPYFKGGDGSNHPLKVRGGRRGYALAAGSDKEKDQSYFLSRITHKQLSRTLFPIGELTKPQVREIARRIGLPVADKEGTSGICFIGERNFESFMKGRVPAAPGPIVDTAGKTVGEHRGLPFYTVGQRHGFGCPSARLGTAAGAAGGEPYYVAKKIFETNTLIVAQAYDPALFRNEIEAIDAHWINEEPKFPLTCSVRLRYRQNLQSCTVKIQSKTGCLEIAFDEAQKAATPGQYAAFYVSDICLGSAVIV